MSWRSTAARSAACVIAAAFASAACAGTWTESCRRIPAEFRDGRVFVSHALASGRSLTLFTDTGGGGSMLTREAAARENVRTESPPPAVAGELGPDALMGEAPLAVRGAPLPIMPAPVLVVPSIFPLPDWRERADGMVGQNWFAGRRWTWDYPAGALYLGCAGRGRRLSVDLPRPDAPPPARQFPRVTVTIDGEPVAMLLDTGATTWLTDDALNAVHDGGAAIRKTSMATATRIARWRSRHPDWRIVEGAQRGTGARMIEVPSVVIAGFDVGPVWFTERPDPNFTRMMSSMMAGPVEGALGGNAL